MKRRMVDGVAGPVRARRVRGYAKADLGRGPRDGARFEPGGREERGREERRGGGTVRQGEEGHGTAPLRHHRSPGRVDRPRDLVHRPRRSRRRGRRPAPGPRPGHDPHRHRGDVRRRRGGRRRGDRRAPRRGLPGLEGPPRERLEAARSRPASGRSPASAPTGWTATCCTGAASTRWRRPSRPSSSSGARGRSSPGA